MEPTAISHEDKLINNFRLFIALLKNQDKSKIEEIISSGIDVDATDSNGNTPMHICVQKCRTDIITLLIENGANILKPNGVGDRPIDVARQLDTQVGKEITGILEVITTQRETALKTNQNTVMENGNKQKTNGKKIKKIMFPKRTGTSGVSGQLYETKLLSLVFLRAICDADIEEFYLATNIRGIGAFDDLCCKYKLKGAQKTVRLFLQAKHRDDPEKGRFTVNDLRSDAGDFYLPKYFDSYLSIISKFDLNNKDPLFRDDIKNVELNFIIYTPAKELFEPKILGKNIQSDKIHKMINTSSNETIFQFMYADTDIDFLTRTILENRVKQLGHNFLEFIFSEKSKVQVIMSDELIQKYHVIFAQKVVAVSQNIVSKEYRLGRFRSEFLKTYDRTLTVLRDTLFKKVVENHCKKIILPKEEVFMYFQQLKEESSSLALSKLIGSLVIYDEKQDKLELLESNIPKKYFTSHEIHQIKEYIHNTQVNVIIFREAVRMAGESKLGSIEFKLPIAFGNLDLTIREGKVNKRIDTLVKALQGLFIKNIESKTIEIDDSCIGQKTGKDNEKLESGIFDIAGGIGGAVGTLLIYDDQRKMLKFNTKRYIPPNAKLLLDKLQEVLPEGENIDNYRINIKLKCFPRTSFHEVEDDVLATHFLNRLWFYTNEAKEDEVESIVKKEIDKCYNADKGADHFAFRIHSDAIYLKFHDEIQKWWMLSSNAPYLTNQSELLDIAKKDVIDSPVLTVLNLMAVNNMKKTGIEFNHSAVAALNLNNNHSGIVNIITQATVLSGVKIKQYYENSNNYAFISFDYIQGLPVNDYNTMISELRETKLEVLIIIYETSKASMGLHEKLHDIINKFKGNKIIIVTNHVMGAEIKLQYPEKYYGVIDVCINLVNCTPNIENRFLESTKIIFQGEKVNLKTVLDEKSKILINDKILRKIINKEKIELGNTVSSPKYEDIKEYYADRHIKREGDKYLVKSFEDIDAQVVLITAQPDMGKSTLLTHLAVETKNIQASCWIVRIDFIEYIETFNEWHSNRTKVNKIQCIKFLCVAALKGVDSKTKFNLCESDNEIMLATHEGLHTTTVLELELFIHYYNSKKVTFIFYGFDSVCPPYEKEVVKMLKIIEDDEIRMWISSSTNATSKTALEHAFGTAYTLEPVNEIGQMTFFNKFWKTNMQMEKLNYEQFSNISGFLQYMAGLGEFGEHERQVIPWISMPLHMLYIVAIHFFQSELNNVSSVTVTEKVKEHLDLDLGYVTTLGRYLEKTPEAEQALELAGTPLHMYIAANYFKCQIQDRLKIIVNTNEIKKKWDIFTNTVALYQRFLFSNLNNIFYQGSSYIDEDVEDEKRKEFIMKHKKLALFAICKDDHLGMLLSEDEINEMRSVISKIQTGEEKSPMLECVIDDAPKFFHLLFAEYSAVEYLAELLKATSQGCMKNIFKHKALWDFIVNIFLMTCPKAVRNAFDYKLKHDPELAAVTSNENCQTIVFELLLKQNENKDTALNFALNEGMTNFMNVLLKCIEVNLNQNNVGEFVEIVKRGTFLLSAFDFKYGQVAKKILNIINNVDERRVKEILSSDEFVNVPVQILSLCGSERIAETLRESLTTAQNHLVSNADNLFGLSVDTVNLIQNVCNIFLQPQRDS